MKNVIWSLYTLMKSRQRQNIAAIFLEMLLGNNDHGCLNKHYSATRTLTNQNLKSSQNIPCHKIYLKKVTSCSTTMLQNSAGTNGGPRSRVCARLTLHSAPHQHQRNFVAALAGGEGQKFLKISGNSKLYSVFSKCFF